MILSEPYDYHLRSRGAVSRTAVGLADGNGSPYVSNQGGGVSPLRGEGVGLPDIAKRMERLIGSDPVSMDMGPNRTTPTKKRVQGRPARARCHADRRLRQRWRCTMSMTMRYCVLSPSISSCYQSAARLEVMRIGPIAREGFEETNPFWFFHAISEAASSSVPTLSRVCKLTVYKVVQKRLA